ncbi:MAG: T9SS type A sorting domain-containing protein [Bacteroidia bacterium]
MKTKLLSIFCLPALFLFNSSFTKAQSPRLQLFEYFDNTSIPTNLATPANTNVDSMMLNHSSQITCIKYHVSWGSQNNTDPMNLQNPTQPEHRRLYYNVMGDPDAKQDGGVSADSTFNGQPVGFTPAKITKRATVTSPFTVSVSHSLNTAHDTIFTHTVVKKTGNLTAGALVAQVVVIEKTVRFTTPPGVSGEKSFQNVVKMMIPSDTGTALPAMNLGDSVVIDLPWKLANVYDENQLCVVSFVQSRDSLNREVYQAGQSFPIPVALDAGTGVIADNTFHCDSINQIVRIKNYGYDTLKSCTINYRLDGGTTSTIPWTGSLAIGATAIISIHFSGLTGLHSLKIYSSNPNGGTDLGHFNDTTITTFTLASPQVTMPLTEGFETAFPPTNWGIINPDNGITWAQGTVGGFGASAKSAFMDFYNISDLSQFDDLYAPLLNLSSDTGHIYCHFNIAYAQYDATYFDTLQVKVTTDCGSTWTTLYSKTGASLATAPNYTVAAFVPTATQWRGEVVDLSAFVGKPNVQIQFHGMNGYGNNLYLDDININHTALGVPSDNSISSLELFPNPSTGIVNLNVQFTKVQGLNIVVTNILGEIISKNDFGKTNGGKYSLAFSDKPPGIYFVRIITDGQTETKKIIINK